MIPNSFFFFNPKATVAKQFSCRAKRISRIYNLRATRTLPLPIVCTFRNAFTLLLMHVHLRRSKIPLFTRVKPLLCPEIRKTSNAPTHLSGHFNVFYYSTLAIRLNNLLIRIPCNFARRILDSAIRLGYLIGLSTNGDVRKFSCSP